MAMGEHMPPHAHDAALTDHNAHDTPLPAAGAGGAHTIPEQIDERADMQAASITPQVDAEPPVEGDDNTPRSEDPSAEPLYEVQHTDGRHHGFLPVSHNPSAPRLSTEPATAALVEPSSVGEGAISHLDLTSITSSVSTSPFLSNHLERPHPHHTQSSNSTISNVTVRPSDFLPQAASAIPRPQTTHPHFPNQAHSALHSQQYSPAQVPSHLRGRNSNPSNYLAFMSSAPRPKDITSTPSGSRTAGNSPSGSPSLYSSGGSPSRPRSAYDEQAGTYSSPFLHHTHQQTPKETHRIDVDRDPISGRKIINDYEIIDELGRGVHGKVKLARHLPTGMLVAIKIVPRFKNKKRLGKSNSHEDKIKREIAILKKARHDNIVSLIEVIDDPAWKKVYIVLEFVELGEVDWRTPGKADICLIEYRRHLRGANGLEQGDAADQEETRILDAGRASRDKLRRREMKKRLLDESSLQHGLWSLEFRGDDTDDEDPHSDTLSRISTHSSRSHRSALPSFDHEPTIPEQSESPPPRNSSLERVATNDFGVTANSPSADADPQHEPAYFAEGEDLATLTASGLEGTMYGSYEDMASGTAPSEAGSIGSRFFEDPWSSRVPDNFKHVPLLTLSQARTVFRDTVLGLEYLHYQGVVHRDIKPANLLETSDHRIKISDFGVSYLGRNKGGGGGNPDQSESEVPDAEEAIELAKTVGTPAFYAPELCQTDYDDEDPPPVTSAIDVWALGVTLYCLIFGRVPFHDNNPFVLMKKIAEAPVHIPRMRLKAVDKSASSRSNSRGHMFGNQHVTKREPYDLEYEVVQDDIHDLLRRLLLKDPRQRMTLNEVKHHPWVLSGVQDPVQWLERTDPGIAGEQIKVSSEDMAAAVKPITPMEKLTSGILRLGVQVGEKLGLGRSSSTRSRAKSSATQPEASGPPSAASSSSTISQDARLAIGRTDEAYWSQRRREPEHPLAQSQTASPEEQVQFFGDVKPLPSQADYPDAESELHSERSFGSAPRPQYDRAASSSATTKTVRQRDVSRALGLDKLPAGGATFPALPSTPTTGESQPHSSIGTFFSDGAKRFINSMRSRDRTADRDLEGSKQASQESLDDASRDTHTQSASGFRGALSASLLRRSNQSSAAPSPTNSRTASITSPDQILPGLTLPSRHSSISSTRSAGYRPSTASRGAHSNTSQQRRSIGPSEDYERAREEYFRRKIAETSKPSSASSSRPRSRTTEACPPSPDDLTTPLRDQQRPSFPPFDHSPIQAYSASPSPVPPRGIETSSSEDQLMSALSQSTSNPSIPSVVSTDSSVGPEYEESLVLDLSRSKDPSADPPSDSSTINSVSLANHDDDDGYVGDNALESDGDDDSDSDGSFLEMGSRKGRGKNASASTPSRSARRATSVKTGRSESGGTLKKVRTRSNSKDAFRPKPA